ncbi:MAG TPA: ABC transporter permease, partial [Gemmatimonadaceae bacterium]|nr:ABC transporter permease [Gemmatimonadaceae bacterium]
MTVRPPRVAAWLLALASSAEDRPYVLGDLEEELRRRALSAGVRAARRWYWSEALASAAPLLHRRLTAPGRTPAARHRDDHAVGGDPMWRDVGFDLLVAARVARRNLAASVAIVLTAALCIGVTTAVFGVVNAVLLRPLPFPDSERVVRLGSVLRDGERTTNLALADLDDFRREVRGYELAAGMTSDRMTLSAPGAEPELVAVTLVDSGYARLFALRAAVGRLFQIEEFVYGGGRVVVISHSYWRRRFGGDPAVLGRTVMLDDEPRVVVGVLAPHAYTYPDPGADALVPLVPHPQSWLRNRGAMWMDAVARLRPGVTPERAQSELGAAAAHIAAQFPAANEGIGAYAEPLRDAVVANVRQMLVLLAAAVAAVLLITCANIANLLLAQAQARGREFAVRAALG